MWVFFCILIALGNAQCGNVDKTYVTEMHMCMPINLAFVPQLTNVSVNMCTESFSRHMCKTQESFRLLKAAQNAFNGYWKAKLIQSSVPLTQMYQSCMMPRRQETLLEYKHLFTTITGQFFYGSQIPIVWAKLDKADFHAPYSLRFGTDGIPELRYAGFDYDLSEHAVYNLISKSRDIHNYNVLDVQNAVTAVLKVHSLMHRNMGNTDSVEKKWEDIEDLVPVEYLNTLGGPLLRFRKQQPVRVYNWRYMQWLNTVSEITVPEWRMWAQFSILMNNYALPRNCTDFTLYLLPGETIRAFKASPEAEEEITYDNQLSEERFEHNVHVIYRHRVGQNLRGEQHVLDDALRQLDNMPLLLKPITNPDVYDETARLAITEMAQAGTELNATYVKSVYARLGDGAPKSVRQRFFMILAQYVCDASILDPILEQIPDFKSVVDCKK